MTPEPRATRRWRGKPGLAAAMATVVTAMAIAAVVTHNGDADGAANASAVRQVVVPPPATAPPTTEASAPSPPPAPTTTATSAPTTTTAAAPTTTATPPAAPPPPAPPPVPLTLSAALAQALGGANGCLIVEDATSPDTVLFERNAGSSFIPASSQKVFVGAAALSRLGGDYRFETKVVASRPPEGGSLQDAWLVGGGDPVLATPDYAAHLAGRTRTVDTPVTPLAVLADELVARGVQSIPGGLQPDESRYAPQRSVPTWKPSYVTEAEVGSLGALTVNEGLITWGPADQRVAPDPAHSAAAALSRLLTDRGVSLPGPAAGGRAPSDGVEIATIQSAPVSRLVAAMLRSSDNYIAEMLVKEIDRSYGGPGLTAGGTARVVELNAALGVPVAGVQMNDGSGLDRGNRATCRALLGALNLSRQPEFRVLDSGLAVAGHSGTLARRYKGSAADFRLAAKTGWINGAMAMVGRIAVNPTRRFALVVNGQFGWPHARELQDRVVDLLTSGLAL